MKKTMRKNIPFHITRSFLTDGLCVLLGTAVLAFSIRGFSGIAILASFLSGGRIPLWMTNLVLNVPLFLIALLQKEWGLLRQSLLGAAALTVWLKVIPEIPFIYGDWFLASVCGGVIMGAAMFLILRVGATSGGTDMLAMLLHRKLLRGISVARILQWIDAVIVIGGVLLVGLGHGSSADGAAFFQIGAGGFGTGGGYRRAGHGRDGPGSHGPAGAGHVYRQ